MKSRRKILPVQRPSQETPAELVAGLMGAIRGQFYGDLPAKRWFEDQHFIRRNVVLWPAHWLDERGVSLPPERYRALLLGILDTIKRHGNTGGVKFWPGYLMKCVQEHFAHHGEEIYEEAKAVRTVAERVLLACGQRAQATPPDPVRVLAEARALLPKGRRKAAVQGACRQCEFAGV